MKKILKKAGLLLIAFLLQFTLVQKLNIQSFSANLCLLAFIGVCFFSEFKESLFFGGIYGLFIDGLAGRNFGVNILMYLYLAVGIKYIFNESHKNSPFFLAADTMLFTVLFYIVYGLLSFAVPRGSITVGRWLFTAAAAALFNGVIALIVYGVMGKKIQGGKSDGRTV